MLVIGLGPGSQPHDPANYVGGFRRTPLASWVWTITGAATVAEGGQASYTVGPSSAMTALDVAEAAGFDLAITYGTATSADLASPFYDQVDAQLPAGVTREGTRILWSGRCLVRAFTFTLEIANDAVDTGNRTFTVGISGATCGTIDNASIETTIQEDDQAPSNDTPASIAGDGYAGSTYTATPGTWSDADTVTGQWYLDGAPITGETGTTYDSTFADIGGDLEYVETATNGVGSVQQASNTISLASPFILDQLGTSAVGAWSVSRVLRAAWLGGPLIRLRRASDDAESDFGADGDGYLDTAAIATWIGGSSGLVKVIYDQSGNAYDHAQGTAGNQPTFTASGGSGSRPGFDASSGDFLSVTAAGLDDLWATDGMCVHVVHLITGTPTGGKYLLQKSNATLFQNWYLALTNTIRPGLGRCTTGALSVRGGSADATASTYVDTINSPLAYNSNPTWRRNGAALTVGENGGIGAGVESDAGVSLAWPGRATTQQTGIYSECVLFASQLSSDDLQALNDDSTTFYGA